MIRWFAPRIDSPARNGFESSASSPKKTALIRKLIGDCAALGDAASNIAVASAKTACHRIACGAGSASRIAQLEESCISVLQRKSGSAGVLVLCLVFLSGQASAQSSKGSPSLELAGLYLVEAWDFNGTPHDRLAGGSLGVSLPVHESWAAVIELLGMHVDRQKPPDAALVGLSALLRKRLTGGQQHLSFAVEGGIGAAYASVEVPDRGTRFNYLLEAGAGVTQPIGRRTSLLLKIRLLHLSNNSLKGRDHNPDIQALGAQTGIAIRF